MLFYVNFGNLGKWTECRSVVAVAADWFLAEVSIALTVRMNFMDPQVFIEIQYFA